MKEISSQIETAVTDHRAYRLIRLDNELEVLLISDPNTEKAGCALDVHVGYFSDPNDVPGLAHFLEHLLFMGTEKYPMENEYQEFLSRHGGVSNAFTTSDHTNYFFEVNPDDLMNALDMFCSFFIHPLFMESCVEREMQAVDSEHKKNLLLDPWRFHQLFRSLSDQEHPFSKFGTGNLDTLKLPEIRQRIIDFYKEFYSSNIMKVCILGKQSLDELQELSLGFAKIKNLNILVPSTVIKNHPWNLKSQANQLILARSLKNKRFMELYWEFPRLEYKTKSGEILGHLFAYEGKGSVLSLLKKFGWAMELFAGSRVESKHVCFFYIGIHLTESGFLHFEDVIVLVFHYIQILQNLNFPPELFNEIKNIMDIKFKFSEITNIPAYLSQIAQQMHNNYDPQHILKGQSCFFDFNQDELKMCTELLNTEFAVLLTQNTGQYENQEKWYGTEYTIKQLSRTLISRIKNAQPYQDLHLPLQNLFLPTEINLQPKIGKEIPEIIIESPNSKVWYMCNSKYLVPYGFLGFVLKSDLINESASNVAMSQLLVKLVRDVINERAYDAELAGTKIQVVFDLNSIKFEVYGFANVCLSVCDLALEALIHLKDCLSTFERVKSDLIQSYRNFYLEMPYKIAIYQMSRALHLKHFDIPSRLEAISNIDLAQLTKFSLRLRTRSFIECLYVGNIHLKALEEWSLKQTRLLQSYSPLCTPQKFLMFPKDNPVFGVTMNTCAVLYSIQTCLLNDLQERNLTKLFASIVQEPAFNELRTKKQLGYIVSAYYFVEGIVCLFNILIQSEQEPQNLELSIDLFLESIEQYIWNLSEENFCQFKKIHIMELTETPKTLQHEARRMYEQIINGLYDFEENKKMAELTVNLTLKQLKLFFETKIKSRAKLSVHLGPTPLGFKDLDSWKQEQLLFPDIQPILAPETKDFSMF